MTDMDKAVAELKKEGLDAIEVGGILVIPFDYVHECTEDEFYKLISKIKYIFKEIGFDKSWQIDPYYYERKRHADGTVIVGPEG
jgi:hypothetical protein